MLGDDPVYCLFINAVYESVYMNKPLLTICLPHIPTPTEEMQQQIICTCRTLKNYLLLWRRPRDKATSRDQIDHHCEFELSNWINVSKKKNNPSKHWKGAFKSQWNPAPAWKNPALLPLHLVSKLWSLFIRKAPINVKHHQHQRCKWMNFNAILISRKHCLSNWIILKIIFHLQILRKT